MLAAGVLTTAQTYLLTGIDMLAAVNVDFIEVIDILFLSAIVWLQEYLAASWLPRPHGIISLNNRS
jgi:hypothetical protein